MGFVMCVFTRCVDFVGANTYVCMCAFANIMQLKSYAIVYIYIYIYTHTRIYIYTHIYIYIYT
jgi:hypothetical protein